MLIPAGRMLIKTDKKAEKKGMREISQSDEQISEKQGGHWGVSKLSRIFTLTY